MDDLRSLLDDLPMNSVYCLVKFQTVNKSYNLSSSGVPLDVPVPLEEVEQALSDQKKGGGTPQGPPSRFLLTHVCTDRSAILFSCQRTRGTSSPE